MMTASLEDLQNFQSRPLFLTGAMRSSRFPPNILPFISLIIHGRADRFRTLFDLERDYQGLHEITSSNVPTMHPRFARS